MPATKEGHKVLDERTKTVKELVMLTLHGNGAAGRELIRRYYHGLATWFILNAHGIKTKFDATHLEAALINMKRLGNRLELRMPGRMLQ